MGVCRALDLAIRIKGRGPVTVLLDSRAAIDRLRHRGIGSGQGLVLRTHEAAKALETRADKPLFNGPNSPWPTPIEPVRKRSRLISRGG
jgi:hypothetical protein